MDGRTGDRVREARAAAPATASAEGPSALRPRRRTPPVSRLEQRGGGGVRAETGKKGPEQRRRRPEGTGASLEVAQKFTRGHVGEAEAGY